MLGSNRCPVCNEWACPLDSLINLPSCWSNHSTFYVHDVCKPEAVKMKARGLYYSGFEFKYPVRLGADEMNKFEKEEALSGIGPIAQRLDEEDYAELHRNEPKERDHARRE